MSNQVRYKGFTASVAFDADAGRLVGSVDNASDPLAFDATSARDVVRQFHAVVDAYVAECEERGAEPLRRYSGRLLVRIDPALHASVASRAADAGLSINAFVERALTVAAGASG